MKLTTLILAAVAAAAPTAMINVSKNNTAPSPVEFFNTSLVAAGTAMSPAGYNSALYFTNWGIYRKNFQPQDIPVNKVNRILYAFARFNPDGTVIPGDAFADLEKHYPGDSWGDKGHNAYGCVKQLFRLKQQHRHLKVLLSIGGWKVSSHFAPVAASAGGRQAFAQSAVRLMGDWGFDGLDIDWEYPQSVAEARDIVLLLQACRRELDAYAQRTGVAGYRFQLTVASPAGAAHYDTLNLPAMDAAGVDAWHLMAYDYAGAWDVTTGHQASLVRSPAVPLATKFATADAVAAYRARGIAPHKILLGLPLYGRAFAGVAGGGGTASLGQPFGGAGGDWDADAGQPSGLWRLRDLPRPGAAVFTDPTAANASFSFDAATRELVSFDTPAQARRKAAYVQQQGLGGAFFWEASDDAPGERSVVSAVAQQLGPLDRSANLLRYPASQYDNIRNGAV